MDTLPTNSVTAGSSTTSVANQLCGLFMPIQMFDKQLEDDYISPFIKYDDGYRWPDLFTEIDEMIEPCVLIYAIAELRKMAREDEILFGSRVLSLPVSHSEIMQVVESNRQRLETTSFGKEFYVNILRAADERKMTRHTDSQGNAVPEKEPSEVHLSPETIVAFDDEYADKELVYMIEVNHRRKRVTITFRGSVNEADWATNYEIFMKDFENPMKKHASQEESVRAHNGFYDYMFEPNQRGFKGPNGEDLSEYQEIFQQHLLPILKLNLGYKLYVTGHSLGAALATLFAFKAAGEPDAIVPKPVSLISVAGPYVGDESFANSFQLMESLGRIRHLRLVNHKDLVTTVPKMSFRWNLFDKQSHVGTLFKHVGMGLRLYDGITPFELMYRKKRSGWWSGSVDEFARGWDQMIVTNFSWTFSSYLTWPWHSLREYSARLHSNKPALETIYLNDLYARPDVVGKLVAQF